MAEQPRESNGHVAKMHEGEFVIPAKEIGSITAKVTIDVADALTGLKALRREADAAVRALNAVRERTLTDYTTCQLTDELARRTGVKEIALTPNGYARLTTDSYGIGQAITEEITGPCRILINVD